MQDEPLADESNAASRAEAECAALLNRLRRAPSSPSTIAARLIRVRAAIATGEFHVDARQIAERLIQRRGAS